MSIVYKNGRLVRESDEERAARLALAASDNAATQEQFDKQRMFGSDAQKNLIKAGRALEEPTATVGPYNPDANDGVGNRVSLITGKPIKSSQNNNNNNNNNNNTAAAATDKALKDAQDRALAYASGMQAVSEYETLANAAKEAALGRLSDVYNPQEEQIANERARQLKMLESLIGQGQTDISQAEVDLLNAIQPTTAYSGMPMVDMEAIQNPLLAALRQAGASEESVESQSAMDKSLGDFMNQLQSQSATRYGDVQQNYLEALRNSGRGASAAGRTYLGQRQAEIGAGVESDYSDMLNELATARASSEASVEDQFNDALSKIIEMKADTTANYGSTKDVKGPAPAGYRYDKSGNVVANLGSAKAGAKKTAASAPPKPSTPAGAGLHWEWNGKKWVPVPNKK